MGKADERWFSHQWFFNTSQVLVCLETASLPTGWGLSPASLPHPQFQTLTATPGCHDQMAKVRPSLGVWFICQSSLQNSETFQFPDDQLIIKGYNSGTVRWKRSAPISHTSPTGSSPNPRLLGFYGGFITQSGLITSSALGDWLNLQPLPSPQKSGSGAEISSPPGTGWVPQVTSPILRYPRDFPNFTLWT